MEFNDEHEDAIEVVPTSQAGQNDVHLESFDATPIMNGSKHTLGKPLGLVTPFGQRKDKFVVHSTLNSIPTVHDIKKEHGEENSDDYEIRRVQPIKRCSLEILCSQPTPGCRYMYDGIEDKFNYLMTMGVSITFPKTCLECSRFCMHTLPRTCLEMVCSDKEIFSCGDYYGTAMWSNNFCTNLVLKSSVGTLQFSLRKRSQPWRGCGKNVYFCRGCHNLV